MNGVIILEITSLSPLAKRRAKSGVEYNLINVIKLIKNKYKKTKLRITDKFFL